MHICWWQIGVKWESKRWNEANLPNQGVGGHEASLRAEENNISLWIADELILLHTSFHRFDLIITAVAWQA